MPEEKVILASILCILGQGKHAPVLAEAIRQYKDWDEGWHYTGMGQFGMCLSRLDALITALGNARDTSVLPTILEKAKKLEPEDYLSHFRVYGAIRSFRLPKHVAMRSPTSTTRLPVTSH